MSSSLRDLEAASLRLEGEKIAKHLQQLGQRLKNTPDYGHSCDMNMRLGQFLERKKRENQSS
jgi:hypothetical protein